MQDIQREIENIALDQKIIAIQEIVKSKSDLLSAEFKQHLTGLAAVYLPDLKQQNSAEKEMSLTTLIKQLTSDYSKEYCFGLVMEIFQRGRGSLQHDYEPKQSPPKVNTKLDEKKPAKQPIKTSELESFVKDLLGELADIDVSDNDIEVFLNTLTYSLQFFTDQNDLENTLRTAIHTLNTQYLKLANTAAIIDLLKPALLKLKTGTFTDSALNSPVFEPNKAALPEKKPAFGDEVQDDTDDEADLDDSDEENSGLMQMIAEGNFDEDCYKLLTAIFFTTAATDVSELCQEIKIAGDQFLQALQSQVDSVIPDGKFPTIIDQYQKKLSNFQKFCSTAFDEFYKKTSKRILREPSLYALTKSSEELSNKLKKLLSQYSSGKNSLSGNQFRLALGVSSSSSSGSSQSSSQSSSTKFSGSGP
ncbi:MAG: hypothetical protein JSR33_00755 [Proteobacteria bacterium]|nr:hypothetical protein [Pseudomonadota bacterium]